MYFRKKYENMKKVGTPLIFVTPNSNSNKSYICSKKHNKECTKIMFRIYTFFNNIEFLINIVKLA